MNARETSESPTSLPTSLDVDIAVAELWRRRSLRMAIAICGGIGIAGIAIGTALYAWDLVDPWLAFAAIITLAAILVAWGACTAGFRSEFKRRLVTPVVTAFMPGLEYQPDAGIERAEFERAGLFPDLAITDYQGEDLIRGRVGDTAIRFSELKVENVSRTRDSDGRSSTRRTTIFSGLFFCADFNKHFTGRTYVLPDTAERFMGALGRTLQGLNSSHGELVALEDPEFERLFVVYASDQIEARYILSSSLMERLLILRKTHGRSFHLAFVDSNLYLAMDLGRKLFEPSLFANLADRRWLHEIWRDLEFLTGLVEQLNLNTRIWSKT